MCLDQYFYSFLLSPHDKIIGKKENCFFPFDLFLQQINPSIYEPHYQVVFKDEIWKTLPVPISNFFKEYICLIGK